VDIRFTAQLTPEDYVRAQRLHAGPRVYFVVGSFMLAVLSLIVFVSGDAHDGRTWVVTGGLWVIWFLVFCLTQPRGMARRAAKTFSQQKTLQVPFEGEITDEKWHVRSEIGESRISWADFHKWKGNKNLVLVYQSDRLFNMFPRRFFISDEEFQSFKELLTRAIGPAGKAKKRT
jgi:Na+/melibiose symporter-like transporter